MSRRTVEPRAARQRLQGQRLITLRRQLTRKPGQRRDRLLKLMLHHKPTQLRNLMLHRNLTRRRSLMLRLHPMLRPSLQAESRMDGK